MDDFMCLFCVVIGEKPQNALNKLSLSYFHMCSWLAISEKMRPVNLFCNEFLSYFSSCCWVLLGL